MLKKPLIAGLIGLIFSFVTNQLVEKIFPRIAQEYKQANMFRPWSDPLMMLYFAYPFILAFVLFYLWKKLNKPKSLELVKIYFIIATIPGMFVTYTSFQVSLGMVLSWTASGLIQVYIAGLVFSKVK